MHRHLQQGRDLLDVELSLSEVMHCFPVVIFLNFIFKKILGLPENVTEPIIHEIFERCGEITTLRLSKKNFCHIRFVFEASVDSAIYLSGYRIKIGNQEPNTNGIITINY